MGCRHKSNITIMPTTHLTFQEVIKETYKSKVLYIPVVVGNRLGSYQGGKKEAKADSNRGDSHFSGRLGHGGCLRSKQPHLRVVPPKGERRANGIFLKQTNLCRRAVRRRDRGGQHVGDYRQVPSATISRMTSGRSM